jgi:hypothetical protein
MRIALTPFLRFSWLFFKARAKRLYLCHTDRASNAEKQPTGPGPEGCDENGPAAALLVGHVSILLALFSESSRRLYAGAIGRRLSLTVL